MGEFEQSGILEVDISGFGEQPSLQHFCLNACRQLLLQKHLSLAEVLSKARSTHPFCPEAAGKDGLFTPLFFPFLLFDPVVP